MIGPNETQALEVDDICVATAQGTPVLRHVSLRLDLGASTGLIGESGSGKSTLALALIGLVPDELASGGRVRLGEQAAYPSQPRTYVGLRGRRIAYVAQDPHAALNPFLKIGRQLDEVRRTHFKERRPVAKEASLAMLLRVGLEDAKSVYDAYSHTLSGGMLQRVALAMALLAEPDVLLADEPTTALDVTLQAQLIALLATLVSELKMSLLLISHDLAVCAQLTDRIVVMFAGEIVEVADTATLLRTPRHPYSAQLLEAARINERGASAAQSAKNKSARNVEQDADMPKAQMLAASGDASEPPKEAFGCAFAYRCPRATQLCRHLEPPLRAMPQTKAREGLERGMVRCFYPLERLGSKAPTRVTPSTSDAPP